MTTPTSSHHFATRPRSLLRAFAVSAGLGLLTCVGASIPLAAQDRVEPHEAAGWSAMADSVEGEFRHAWTGYLRHARGHDDLRPLSRGHRDWYEGGSLQMTPVDALDTMLLMGLDEEAATAKRLALEGLDFDRDVEVQVFEVTIRLLGGLLSAHQMEGDPRLLELARDLGDRLLPAFDSPTGMPYRYVNLRTGETSGPVSNPAEIGTLTLEFGTLSRLTGEPAYYEAAKGGVEALFHRRSELGLVGSAIDVETGAWQNATSHVGGGIDSYYEYLLKGWLLFGDPDLGRMWRESRESMSRWLADEADSGLWYGHADMRSGERTATLYGALDAFLPGVLALGSRAAGSPARDEAAAQLEDRARRLMDSVDQMWTRWGIEPEVLDYETMEIRSPGYRLRPEAIESAYYLWRFTGDERYREMGRRMFGAVVEACRVEGGYASLEDVRTGERADHMPSYFLAETLKYAWLLFSPPDRLELRTSPEAGAGGVVFNTEAHPLRRASR